MNIFIDESGSFTPVSSGYSPSVIGALIVPDHKLKILFEKYARIRHNLPKSRTGEVKGKLLSETQVSKIVDLLRINSCLFEATVIEMRFETAEGLEYHRAEQANHITKNLTSEHLVSVIEGVMQWRKHLETMPLPLYVHSALMFETLATVLQHAPLYYVQRRPRELENFHWVIDGKDVSRITNTEVWWSETMLPMLQSKSIRNPIPALEGADYSHFDKKFMSSVPDFLQPHFPDETAGVDLRRIMKESFRFSSDPEYGLELVDIVVNATRRALKGNLQETGWCGIPLLMIRRQVQCLRLVRLSAVTQERQGPYADIIIEGFGRGSKSMLPDKAYRDIVAAQ